MSDAVPEELQAPLLALWQSDQMIVAPMLPRDAFQAVAVIQFACRNPQLSHIQRESAEQIARVLQKAVTRLDPIVGKYLEMGWNTEFDTTEESPFKEIPMTKRDEYMRRYEAAAHAVQAGVQIELNDDPPSRSGSAASPKMLRTGLNLAIVEHGALVRVLIAKGLFTEDEYLEALIKGVEDEQHMYEERLTARFGGKGKITLA